jgi:hypothetical protein
MAPGTAAHPNTPIPPASPAAQGSAHPVLRARFFDIEFYSARVTDLWMWEASSHQAYEMLIEELRETPFWDWYFSVVEILPGVENAYANNYGQAPLLGA